MTGFKDSGGWPIQEGLSGFCHIFAPSTYCKYDFIPFTSRQWASIRKLKTGHITLSAVPVTLSKEICKDAADKSFIIIPVIIPSSVAASHSSLS